MSNEPKTLRHRDRMKGRFYSVLRELIEAEKRQAVVEFAEKVRNNLTKRIEYYEPLGMYELEHSVPALEEQIDFLNKLLEDYK